MEKRYHNSLLLLNVCRNFVILKKKLCKNPIGLTFLQEIPNLFILKLISKQRGCFLIPGVHWKSFHLLYHNVRSQTGLPQTSPQVKIKILLPFTLEVVYDM